MQFHFNLGYWRPKRPKGLALEQKPLTVGSCKAIKILSDYTSLSQTHCDY